jgi:hypothetical protein
VTLRPPVFVALLALAACAGNDSTTMQFYPLQGTIADTDPTYVIEATMKNVRGTSGPLAFQLPDKVQCEGTWSSLTPKTVSRSGGFSLTWRKTGGEVGGETKTEARVNDGELYAVCSDGRRVQGTFVIGSGTASGSGSATDTDGNVYKLLF